MGIPKGIRIPTADLEYIVPSEIFSPDSGGRVKVSSAMLEIRTHGMMRLKA